MKKLLSLFAAILFVGSIWADTYEKFTGALVEGDYLITYDGGAMKNTVSSNRLSFAAITVEDDAVADPDESIIWHIAPSGDYWTIYNAAVSKYAAGTGTKNQAGLLASGTDDKSLWTASGSATYEFINKAHAAANINRNLRKNGTYGFACYATGTGGALTLYKKAESANPDACATPKFSPAAGIFTSAQSVTISTTTADATIYYTIGDDPDDPTTDDAEYTGAIEVSASTTIKAIAVKNGLDNSAVATAIYTIVLLDHAGTAEDPYTVAVARQAIDAGVGLTNVYAKGIVSEVGSISSGQLSYYLSDDGETTSDQLQAYKGKYIGGENFTVANSVREGDEVIVTGTLTKYNDTYEFGANNQLYSLVARTPNFTISNVEFRSIEDADLTVADLTVNKEGEGAVTFVSSSDETVATVTAEAIHPLKAGDVTITAKLAANGIYRETTTTFTVNFIEVCHNIVTLSKGTTEHGSFTLNRAEGEYPTCDAELTVDVTPTPAEHYHVLSVIAPNSASISEPDEEGKYTVTFAQNTNASSEIKVTFDEDAKSTVTWSVNTDESLTTEVYNGEKPVFPATPAAFDEKSTTFYGWADKAWSGQAPDLDAEVLIDITIYTSAAALPAVNGDVTYYAVFAQTSGSATTKTYGFEDEEADADLWVVNGPVKTEWTNASGSYAGKITTNNTYVTFKEKVPVTNFSFKFARTSTNNNYYVYIETSENGTDWTAAETYAMSGFTNGTLDSKSKDFDGTEELYVRFHCYNTTAARYVDDLSITYGAISYGRFTVTKLDPTAIDNTEVGNKALKTIENGMLIIERDGVRYNVMGQIVK